MTTILAGAYSAIGKRPVQEDAYVVSIRAGIFAAIDGVATSEHGDVAAALTAIALMNISVANRSPSERLEDAFAVAQVYIDAFCTRKALVKSCCCATALLWGGETDPRHVTIAHAGDTRAYRLDDMKLRQLTTDDTSMGYVTRIVGIAGTGADIGQSIVEYSAIGPTWYLLVTDGVTKCLTDDFLAVMVYVSAQNGQTPQEIAKNIVDVANASGKTKDNITAVVVYVP